MKRSELSPGMAVYYVQHASAWKRNSEDVQDARWVVADDKRYGRHPHSFKVSESAKGALVKITKERTTQPFSTKPCNPWTDIKFVSLAQLRGPYEQVAAERRALFDAAKAANEQNQREASERQEALDALVGRARGLGYNSVSTFRGKTLTLYAEDLERLLDELAAVRAENARLKAPQTYDPGFYGTETSA